MLRHEEFHEEDIQHELYHYQSALDSTPIAESLRPLVGERSAQGFGAEGRAVGVEHEKQVRASQALPRRS